MIDDDIQSPVLGRRQILGGASVLGVLALVRLASGGPALLRGGPGGDLGGDLDVSDLYDAEALQSMCVVTPSETAGPFYLDLNLLRSDITEGKPGIPTRMILNVVHASDCTPVANAACDIWHCDALGSYSGFQSQGTAGQTFLRGVQFTDATGQTFFDTIYPGWYPGRTTHIHIKVRPTGTSELTSQMYFPQALNTRVSKRPPYVNHGPNPTTNAGDGLFLQETVVNVLGVVAGKLQLQLTIGVA